MQAILRLFLWLLLCVVIGVAMTGPLSAQTPEKRFKIEGLTDPTQSIAGVQGKRWALLVGIADYPSRQGYEIQPLKAPVKDVNALAVFLKDPQKGGFDADHVFTLTDKQATRRDILITFNDIAKRTAPEDMVIFYFSGHGYRPSDSETTYLIPYDFDMRDIDATCINFEALATRIRKMEASKVVVILDACNSGGVKPMDARSSANTGLVQRYLEAFQKSEGRALLLSSDEAEVSWETEQNGVFTHFLLDGLDGKADTNSDGIITFTEVALYVEEAVPRYTRERFPRVQRPTRRYEFGQVRGDIPLAINWSTHEAFRQKDLRDSRTGAILQVSLAGLDQTLKEFSLKVVQSAYRKSLNGDPLTNQEKLLLPEMDALQAGTITATDYIVRARAIYKLGIPMTQLQISVTPADATVVLASADTPNRVIAPFSPNVYRVPQGGYRISAQRPGYALDSRHLTLGGESETMTVTLERLMGTLRLQVDPSDATVMVTPLNVAAPDIEIIALKDLRIQPTGGRKLPVGTYRVTAEKAGYEPSVRAPVEIVTYTPTRVTLTLKPKPATIAAPNLPQGTQIFVNGSSVTLPYGLLPGTHSIRLEREGFEPVEMAERLEPEQVLSLRPKWIPIKLSTTDIPITPPTTDPLKGIPRGTAFAASLVVPGLGQHLQGRREQGWLYAGVAAGATVAALWARSRYHSALEDYDDYRDQLPVGSVLTDNIRDLLDKQDGAYNDAESARTLTIATQAILGVVWGINVLDAGVAEFGRQNRGVALDAHPTAAGGQILVRVLF